jgi:threonine/homoserine/homoserine lactone efflux protein
MTRDLFLALLAFAFVTSATPGPNNLMLMASGANFGLRRSLQHLFGVAVGFMVMCLLVGLGLGGLFDLWPPAHGLLKWASVLYMLWLAAKIARAAPPGEGVAGGTPLSFLQAAAFQWVNPKAWAIALGAMAAYAPDRDLRAVLVVAAVFGLMTLPSVGVWTLLGQGLRRWLSDLRHLRIFNWTMAGLLVASLLPVVF